MAAFVPYLVLSDYLSSIQDGQLNKQVLGLLTNPTKERRFAESYAMGCVRSYLKSEYDLSYDITPTLPYVSGQKYYGNQRIVIDFDNWVAGTLYQVGACVIKDNIGYECMTQNQDSAFNPNIWFTLGNKDDMYYIALPHPLFSLNLKTEKGAYVAGFYQIDNKVWWENHIYTALQPSILISHDAAIQYPSLASIPPPNTFPNDYRNGKSYWKDEGEYFVEGRPFVSEEPDNISVWTLGDNRDPMLVQAIMDIAIWKLHSRISPNNIPELRVKNFHIAMDWLREVNGGRLDSDITPLQPKQGASFRGGSNVKVSNRIV